MCGLLKFSRAVLKYVHEHFISTVFGSLYPNDKSKQSAKSLNLDA